MQVINQNTVVVFSSDELKQVLTEENTYNYIYLGKDITLISGFTISSLKEEITIDGTYQDNKYTYTNYLSDASDVIIANKTNKKITLKNMNIISSHAYGVIYVASHPNFSNLTVEYNNINFTGIQLSCNYYGITKIIDSILDVKETNSVPAQRAWDCNRVILDGKTNITSSATTSTVFLINDVISSYLKISPNSNVNITTNKELMNGTNKLDLTVGHGAVFTLTTGNGFSVTTTHGARNVLIEEMATFTFIENSHQRVPMWNVFGDFKVLEGASVSIINTYLSTPTDNYNIYFKGTNQNFILDNPKSINIYTKNANIFYTNNPVSFSFKYSRINMWIDALDYSTSCTLDDIPTLSWYKDDELSIVKGTFSKDSTSVSYNNYTAEELSKFPDISNFSFLGRKILTIGMIKINIHSINNISNVISGHTNPLAKVQLEYGDKKLRTDPDENGLFEFDLDDALKDNTSLKITTCLDGYYWQRQITTPFNGELTLLSATGNIIFDEESNSILPKKESNVIRVIDSRTIKNNWKLYIYFINPMEYNTKYLLDSLIFKKFDNEIFEVTTNKELVYENTPSSGNVEISNITFSTDKGLLLNPKNNLYIDDDYSTLVIWSIEG